MAAARAPIFNIAGRHSPTDKFPAGWVGSKAGKYGHFAKVDASGFGDQAAAAGAVCASVRVAPLMTDVASSVAASSDDAKAVRYRPCDDETEIELPMITSGTSFSTLQSVALTHGGDLIGLARRTEGDYCWDSTGNDYARVKRVNVAKGTLTCVLLPAMRLP